MTCYNVSSDLEAYLLNSTCSGLHSHSGLELAIINLGAVLLLVGCVAFVIWWFMGKEASK